MIDKKKKKKKKKKKFIILTIIFYISDVLYIKHNDFFIQFVVLIVIIDIIFVNRFKSHVNDENVHEKNFVYEWEVGRKPKEKQEIDQLIS